jgi:hypothetical protein
MFVNGLRRTLRMVPGCSDCLQTHGNKKQVKHPSPVCQPELRNRAWLFQTFSRLTRRNLSDKVRSQASSLLLFHDTPVSRVMSRNIFPSLARHGCRRQQLTALSAEN